MRKPWSRNRFRIIMRCIKRKYIYGENWYAPDDLETHNLVTHKVMIKQLLALGYSWDA